MILLTNTTALTLISLTDKYPKTKTPLAEFPFLDIIIAMIKSFDCKITKQIWTQGTIRRKDLNKLGGLDLDIAFDSLMALDNADEKTLTLIPSPALPHAWWEAAKIQY